MKGRGNLSNSTIIKIVYGTRCAIHKRFHDKDAEQLRKDLHELVQDTTYSGYHELCDSSWCNCVGNGNYFGVS